MVAMFVSKILILGSGPNVIEILEQDLSGYDKIVVINNAWKVVEGWTDHIFPHDFPNQNKPQVLKSSQKKVDEKQDDHEQYLDLTTKIDEVEDNESFIPHST